MATARAFSIFIITFVISAIFSYGQETPEIKNEIHPDSILSYTDTLSNSILNKDSLPVKATLSADSISENLVPYSQKRVLEVAGIHVGLYAGTLVLLNQAWYKDYPKSSFKTINDWPEWEQVDKFGHLWSSFQLSRASMTGWKWAGLSEKKQILLGAASGFAFMTTIEILDAYSKQWGWSWGDFGANLAGSGLFAGQHLLWGEERISLKFSFHKMKYEDQSLNIQSDVLYGNSPNERMLKDYNGQTYWLSFNMKSFFPKSKWPAWLNIAGGYGATGMFGAKYNNWTDAATGQYIERGDIIRRKEFYLAPDIDFTKIPTNKKWVKSLFFILNAFKMPAPTMVLSNGKVRIHGFYF